MLNFSGARARKLQLGVLDRDRGGDSECASADAANVTPVVSAGASFSAYAAHPRANTGDGRPRRRGLGRAQNGRAGLYLAAQAFAL